MFIVYLIIDFYYNKGTDLQDMLKYQKDLKIYIKYKIGINLNTQIICAVQNRKSTFKWNFILEEYKKSKSIF